jgi:acetyl esterase
MDTTLSEAATDESAVPPLDPVIAEILAEAAALPRLDPETTPIDRQRRAVEMAAAAWNDPPHPCARVETLSVPTAWGAMRARLYLPEGAREDEAILYAHGGGWTFGSVDTHDGLTRRLASACRRPVLSIDYRLAPEHPFPAPAEDAAAGFAFLQHGGIGAPIAASRIVVAGDSAGAQTVLALLVARREAGLPTPAAGLIFYGCLAPDFDTASHRAFGRDETFLLATERMRWYWANHLGPRAEDPGFAAPLRAPLHDLPPLFLDAASHDCLRDDTLRLAAKLAAIGAPHRLRVTPGVVHGYLRFAKRLPAATETLAAAGAFLDEIMAR